MLSRKMPYGSRVTYMEYYPNQLHLKLTWYNQLKNTLTQTTYLEVPAMIATRLNSKVTVSEIMSYVSKEIKGKYKIGDRKKL